MMNLIAEMTRTELLALAADQIPNPTKLDTKTLTARLTKVAAAAEAVGSFLSAVVAPVAAPEAAPKVTLTKDEEAEAKETGELVLRAKDVAALAGTDAFTFRAFLRDLGGYDDKAYTRYGWVQGSPEIGRILAVWGENQARIKAEAEKKAIADAAATTQGE